VILAMGAGRKAAKAIDAYLKSTPEVAVDEKADTAVSAD
jgi:hypothetical protein